MCRLLGRNALSLVGRPDNIPYMLTPCLNCAHALWSEVRSVGALRLIVYFDDDQGSETYAEHVARCPGCGDRLDGNALDIHEEPGRGLSEAPT